jgi:hypothetical protein
MQSLAPNEDTDRSAGPGFETLTARRSVSIALKGINRKGNSKLNRAASNRPVSAFRELTRARSAHGDVCLRARGVRAPSGPLPVVRQRGWADTFQLVELSVGR